MRLLLRESPDSRPFGWGDRERVCERGGECWRRSARSGDRGRATGRDGERARLSERGGERECLLERGERDRSCGRLRSSSECT